MSGPEPQPGRWVAIVTGAISILIGVLYLALIAVLDSRGPLQPPPPEAMGGGRQRCSSLARRPGRQARLPCL